MERGGERDISDVTPLSPLLIGSQRLLWGQHAPLRTLSGLNRYKAPLQHSAQWEGVHVHGHVQCTVR